MWHFGIWFSRHGGVGWMVGLHDLRSLFQPMIIWFYETILLCKFKLTEIDLEKKVCHLSQNSIQLCKFNQLLLGSQATFFVCFSAAFLPRSPQLMLCTAQIPVRMQELFSSCFKLKHRRRRCLSMSQTDINVTKLLEYTCLF